MHLEKVVNGVYVLDDAWLYTEESRNSSYPSKRNFFFSRGSNVGHSQSFVSFHVCFFVAVDVLVSCHPQMCN